MNCKSSFVCNVLLCSLHRTIFSLVRSALDVDEIGYIAFGVTLLLSSYKRARLYCCGFFHAGSGAAWHGYTV